MYYENVLFLIVFYVSIGGWGWIFTDHLTWIVINYLGYCYIKAIYQPVGDEYIVGCRWAEKGQETRGSSIKGIERLESQEDQGLRGSRVKRMKVIKGQGDLGWLQVSNLNIFIYLSRVILLQNNTRWDVCSRIPYPAVVRLGPRDGKNILLYSFVFARMRISFQMGRMLWIFIRENIFLANIFDQFYRGIFFLQIFLMNFWREYNMRRI